MAQLVLPPIMQLNYYKTANYNFIILLNVIYFIFVLFIYFSIE